MKTLKEMTAILITMGCKRPFKPYWEPESGKILLQVRHPAKIVDGDLTGSEIDVYDHSTFRIWTSKRRKAKEIAALHGLRIRLLDGECELFVPAHLADEVLRCFRAKIKKSVSAEGKARLRAIGFGNRTENRT